MSDNKGVVCLHGNLYRVRYDMIKYSEGDFNPEEELKFFNPRKIIVGDKASNRGLGKAAMQGLYDSIRTEGLHHPLKLIGGADLENQKFTLIGGERRKRCIDRLIKENAMCMDTSTNKMAPASEVYAYIDCRLFIDADLQTAFRVAFNENDKAEGIGEGATVSLIRIWRKAGWGDKEILEITGMSISWLKDTDAICSLDDKTFASFANEEINRTVALHLAQVVDANDRHARLARAKELAAQRVKSIVEQGRQDLQAAENAAEIAEAAIQDATSIGDSASVAKANIKAAKARAKIEKKTDDLKALDENSPKVTGRDLAAVEEEVGIGGRQLTMAKIEKHWMQGEKGITEIIKGIKRGDKEFDGIDMADAVLVHRLWYDGIESDNKDIALILKKHKKNK